MRRLQAVLIGADSIPGLEVRAARDAAVQMRAFLEARATPDSTILALTGADPTRSNVRDALAAARAAFKPDDLHVLMYSGHGFDSPTEQAWVLNDGNFTDTELADHLKSIDKPGIVAVADDCCFAAEMFEPGPDESKSAFEVRRKLFLAYRRRRVKRLVVEGGEEVAFVLAASASSVMVHVGNESEFVRTLVRATTACNRSPPIDHYGKLQGEMRREVPEPTGQAVWSVRGRAPAGQDWEQPSPFRVAELQQPSEPRVGAPAPQKRIEHVVRELRHRK